VSPRPAAGDGPAPVEAPSDGPRAHEQARDEGPDPAPDEVADEESGSDKAAHDDAADVGPDEVADDDAGPDEAEPDERAASPVGPGAARRSRGSRRRRVLVVVLVVLVVLLGSAGWLAVRVYQAGRALLAAQDGMNALVQDARGGDLAAIRVAIPPVRAQLDTARRAVDDPVWRVATVVPWAGRQLGAVRTVTVSLDQVVDATGPALDALDTALAAQDAPHTDGRLVLGPLVDALPPILAAADRVDASTQAILAIDPKGLTPRLAAPVTTLQHQLADVAGTVRSGTELARLLPTLLGSDGPRNYLLVALNSAELRTQGGIVGAMALLHADNGSIDLVDQKTTSAFPGLDTPILPMTPEENLVQTGRLGRWIQNATMTPDFPRTGQLVAARWEALTGQHLDGVIATDPVAASELLRAIGAVTVPSGTTVNADTLIPQLLHDAYVNLPYTNLPGVGQQNTAADALTMEVSAGIFRAVGNGQGSRISVVDALARAAKEGRLRIWSSHEDEERNLLASRVGAAFLSGSYPNDAGVFLDDGTAGKLDYYLTTAVTVENLVCSGPDPSATVRLDLSYQPPADIASQPRYVTGYPVSNLPTGWVATNITVYTPVGAELGALGMDDQYVSGTMATEDGRAVQVVTSWLKPGDHVTYRATVPLHGGALTVWSTPTLTSNGMQTATCGG